MKTWLISLVAILIGGTAFAQYDLDKDFKLKKPEDGKDVASTEAPKGAKILFDGSEASLKNWVKRGNPKEAAAWKLVDGKAMQVNGGDIMTAELFEGSFKLHVEFRVPYMPKASGQGRGNSGVYVQGRFEVQVLDSYGLDSKDNDCGGIYSVAKPLVNACKAPTIWQSYDIEFTAPKYEGGKKVAPAVITVLHNGVKIHDAQKIDKDNTTAGLGGDPSKAGPVLLQDHGNPVQYRNIWLEKK
jgi:hypothetical protein